MQAGRAARGRSIYRAPRRVAATATTRTCRRGPRKATRWWCTNCAQTAPLQEVTGAPRGTRLPVARQERHRECLSQGRGRLVWRGGPNDGGQIAAYRSEDVEDTIIAGGVDAGLQPNDEPRGSAAKQERGAREEGGHKDLDDIADDRGWGNAAQ
eukprot:1325979-Prymnesium_polylepis.1